MRDFAVLAVAVPFLAIQAMPAEAQTASTRFSRDPALLQAKQQKLVEITRRENPQLAQAMEQLFKNDIIAALEPAFRSAGLDSSDMADMTVAYWINAWEAANGIVDRQTDRTLVQAAKRQISRMMAKDPKVAATTDAQRQDVADTMIIQSLLVAGRMEAARKSGPQSIRQMSDMVAREAQQILKVDMRAVSLTEQGFKPKVPAQASTAAGRQPTADAVQATAGGRHASNWRNVEGVYFRSYTTFGVGGLMIQEFEPVVLFRDGTYYRIEDAPLEDVDLAARRAAKPTLWGRWQKTGSGFVLVDNGSKSRNAKPMALQDGQFFKAFPAEAGGGKLSKTYSRVSGGGNTMLGGTTMVGGRTDITFLPDGSFGRKSGGGGMDSGGWTGVGVAVASRNRSAGGSYTISKHTIAMVQPDGTTKRQFFAFGSKGKQAAVDTEMMFLGDNVFSVLD